MTRQITASNYTATCADLIVAFGDALRVVTDPDAEGSVEHEETSTRAFELALECGWDSLNDDDFAAWALKATGQEILVEGLKKALAAVHDTFREHGADWRAS